MNVEKYRERKSFGNMVRALRTAFRPLIFDYKIDTYMRVSWESEKEEKVIIELCPEHKIHETPFRSSKKYLPWWKEGEARKTIISRVKETLNAHKGINPEEDYVTLKYNFQGRLISTKVAK